VWDTDVVYVKAGVLRHKKSGRKVDFEVGVARGVGGLEATVDVDFFDREHYYLVY
jgi:hypothetical protein